MPRPVHPPSPAFDGIFRKFECRAAHGVGERRAAVEHGFTPAGGEKGGPGGRLSSLDVAGVNRQDIESAASVVEVSGEGLRTPPTLQPAMRECRHDLGWAIWPPSTHRTSLPVLDGDTYPPSGVTVKVKIACRRIACSMRQSARRTAKVRRVSAFEADRSPRVSSSGGTTSMVAWDGVEPPTRGFSVRTSCGTTCLHLSLSPSIQRVTTTLDRAAWPIFSIETNSSAKVQPKSKAACGDPGPDE